MSKHGFTDTAVEATDMGSGVVLFRGALAFDKAWAVHTFASLVQNEHGEMYEETVNPETGQPAYLNKSGYLFDKPSIDAMPKRASRIHQSEDEQVMEFLNLVEKAKDNYLFKYFELYPLAYNCVWWKVKGHIVSYGPDVYLGSHSDISAEYIYGVHKTSNELALRNVISAIVYINSSEPDPGELDFSDGHHVFDTLKIDVQPQQGDILFFPSNYVAAHQVLPVGSGTRLSYLGWYCQGTPNKDVNEDVVDPNENPHGARVSTNVYLPTMRDDYRSFLLSRGHQTSSAQYKATELNLE